MVSRLIDFRMYGRVVLSAPWNGKVCVFVFLSSWCGAWREMVQLFPFPLGSDVALPKVLMHLERIFFLILSIGSQSSTISQHRLSCSKCGFVCSQDCTCFCFLSRLSLQLFLRCPESVFWRRGLDLDEHQDTLGCCLFVWWHLAIVGGEWCWAEREYSVHSFRGVYFQFPQKFTKDVKHGKAPVLSLWNTSLEFKGPDQNCLHFHVVSDVIYVNEE